MLKEERFLRIVKFLEQNKTATFSDLSEVVEVSVGTVRRDLKELEENGSLKIVRGGAIYRSDDLTRQVFDIRGIEHKAEKQELARLVETVVVDGQTIALNSGTTNIEVAKFLVKNYYRLTIITNNLRIIDILKQGKDFTIIVPGGVFDPKESAIFGKSCEDMILSYNIDTALIAVNGISYEKGITDFRMKEVGIIRALLSTSKYKAVVADSSKFERVAYLNVCSLSEIDCIITDPGVSQDIVGRYGELNVKIIKPTEIESQLSTVLV